MKRFDFLEVLDILEVSEKIKLFFDQKLKKENLSKKILKNLQKNIKNTNNMTYKNIV